MLIRDVVNNYNEFILIHHKVILESYTDKTDDIVTLQYIMGIYPFNIYHNQNKYKPKDLLSDYSSSFLPRSYFYFIVLVILMNESLSYTCM